MTHSGIYKIQSILHPERCYIGSAISLKNREDNHFSNLKNNQHINPKLQHHYNKYGKEDLVFAPLVYCNKEDLIIQEQLFLDVKTPWFNLCPIANSTTGRIVTEETRKKIGEAHKGNKNCVGRILSIETKNKISQSHIGKVISEETKQKLREANTGKKRSEETKHKLSIAKIGNKSTLGQHHTEEYKKKMSEMRMGINNPFYGRKHSEETRRKMTEIRKRKK
jgi:group I intron endonuclease